MMESVITLAAGEECEGYAPGSVRLSAQMRNSKIIAPIYLIFVHKKYYTHASPLLSDDPYRDLDSIIYSRIRHHQKIGQSMPQRQTCIIIKTCVMTSHVPRSERGSVIADCLVTLCF